MKKNDENIEKYVRLDTYELDKAIEGHQKKLKSLSLPAFIKFEEKSIKSVFDLFKEDKDNSKILNRSLIVNPYTDIYKIPLHYDLEIKPANIIKEIKILVYPNYMATGKFRIDFLQLNVYGDLIQSLVAINKPFTIQNIIQNIYSKNNNLDFSSIEKKMTKAIRHLLCNQSLILE
jgi:hypothetical protein